MTLEQLESSPGLTLFTSKMKTEEAFMYYMAIKMLGVETDLGVVRNTMPRWLQCSVIPVIQPPRSCNGSSAIPKFSRIF